VNSPDDLLENLYRLRCSCEEQLTIARKTERIGLVAEVEAQLALVDEMIERSCGSEPFQRSFSG
jgi:hypothetical protein